MTRTEKKVDLVIEGEQKDNKPICVIVTTFNRREITQRFLISLVKELGKCEFSSTIILVDDSSKDGTPEMVSKEFPDIVLLKGTGHLYWAGGVRFAINHLGDSLNAFRGILLINDDVVLIDESIASITKIAEEHGGLIGGTVVTHTGEIESTGGVLGRICKPKQRLRVANGLVQNCDLLSGHVLYIPMKVYKSLEGFDVNLPYRFIDLEFSLRAKRAGIPVLLAPKIVAFTDEVHNYFKETSSMRGSLSQLIQGILLHPKGPHWRESAYYLKKVSPILWWFWLPFYYRAFFVALIRSYFEKLNLIRK